jgi:hypothetical protein
MERQLADVRLGVRAWLQDWRHDDKALPFADVRFEPP